MPLKKRLIRSMHILCGKGAPGSQKGKSKQLWCRRQCLLESNTVEAFEKRIKRVLIQAAACWFRVEFGSLENSKDHVILLKQNEHHIDRSNKYFFHHIQPWKPFQKQGMVFENMFFFVSWASDPFKKKDPLKKRWLAQLSGCKPEPKKELEETRATKR